MTSTGSVQAGRDIQARDIITGLKIDNLTVVFNGLDDLARILAGAEARFRPTPAGAVEVVTGEQVQLTLPPALLEAFRQLPLAGDLTAAERHRAYAGWLVTRRPRQPVQRVAARDHYVPLSGHTSWDWQEDLLQPQLSYLRVVGQGPEQRLEREHLVDVAEAVARFPAFVLLGPPGSGKSTVLERLAYSTARDYLAGAEARLPLWLTLAGYRWPGHSPLEFVSERWARLAADDFVELARAGRLLLLVDGLNEMPRLSDPDQRAERAGEWQHFIEDFFAEDGPGGSQAVLASRDAADYEQRLGLPRVEIEALTPEQIEGFAQAYLAGQAATFLTDLARLELKAQAANPFSLFILTQLYEPAQGGLPPNKGLMLARYATGLLSVMYPRQDQALQGALQALAELGYALQASGEGTEVTAATLLGSLPAQVSLPRRRQPLSLDPNQVFERAWRAGLLSQVDEAQDTFKFSHQLLQEQFAARSLVARLPAGADLSQLWAGPRTPAEMPPPATGEWDPLPPPPATTWEQPTILAAGISERPDALVQAVLAVNPALAGRCLSEGAAPVGLETRRRVQQALLADLADRALHRRTRLQAGQVLGGLGDPRFEPVEVNGVSLIRPELLAIPGGTATLGSEETEAYDDEQPLHQVAVASFYLARTPVTNAEYACFITASGYNRVDYWTPAGWQWRQGQLAASGLVEELREWYDYLREHPEVIEQNLEQGAWAPDTSEAWRTLIRLAPEEARRRFEDLYPVQAHEQPHYWTDPAYNRPNQPVVGVTWYEAMAYCAWLHQQLAGSDWPVMIEGEVVALGALLAGGGWQVRLPGEAEWEWAAGGPNHKRYPWGQDFDPDRTNTLEGRVLGTSPVGAYPAGAAECRALDLSGNVWEWSHSLYRPYPYRAGDGREEPLAEGRRTLRGGSWNVTQGNARVAVRPHGLPDYFLGTNGFRVVVAPIFP
jgi:formylglycine-generating enzyme required for sulfatase activity